MRDQKQHHLDCTRTVPRSRSTR